MLGLPVCPPSGSFFRCGLSSLPPVAHSSRCGLSSLPSTFPGSAHGSSGRFRKVFTLAGPGSVPAMRALDGPPGGSRPARGLLSPTQKTLPHVRAPPPPRCAWAAHPFSPPQFLPNFPANHSQRTTSYCPDLKSSCQFIVHFLVLMLHPWKLPYGIRGLTFFLSPLLFLIPHLD